jgi:general secretion pathway protein G
VRGKRQAGRGRSGFTLVEILVVVVIIGLLAAAIVPSVIGRVDEAKVVRARSDVRAIWTAVELFRQDTGRYPTPEEGLRALVEQPADVKNWKGYIEGRKSVPKDPWGREYQGFRNEGGIPPYEVVSYGADGKPGGEGYDADVSSAHLDDAE